MKKLFSILLVFSIVFSLAIGSSLRSYAEIEAENSEEEPEGGVLDAHDGVDKTNVLVHKILMSKAGLDAHDADKNYDPTKPISNLAEHFGADSQAKEIAGAYFLAVEDGKKSQNNIVTGDTVNVANIDAYLASMNTQSPGSVFAVTTAATGGKLILPDGHYTIYEIKERSTFKEDGKLLAESKAVPISLTLPFVGSSGKASTVHVYPKNTSDKPQIDKFVGSVGGKRLSVDFGEEHDWLITSTIPSDIASYKKFTFTDKLAPSLEFVADSVSVKILDGSTEGEYAGGAPTVTAPTTANNNTLTVDFSTVTSTLDQYKGKKLLVKFKAKLKDTEDLNIAYDIPNDVKLTYGHNPNNEVEVNIPPENPTNNPPRDPNKPTTPNNPGLPPNTPNDPTTPNYPRIYVGGAKFVKKNNAATENLSGAKFLVKNAAGKYLAVENGSRVWKEFATVDAAKAFEGIVVLTSGADGSFEIRGLKYGTNEGSSNNGSTTYKLVEIEAPEGYALPTNEFDFTVNSTSYSGAENTIVTIKNNKLSIPQTGGIGTVIFTVVGLSLITVSFLAIRKKKSNQ